MMPWYDKAPLSLIKAGGDIVDFPKDKSVEMNPERGADLGHVADRAVDKLKAMVAYMEDALEPGELYTYSERIEDLLVEFIGSLARIENSLIQHQEEMFSDEKEDGELLNLLDEDT